MVNVKRFSQRERYRELRNSIFLNLIVSLVMLPKNDLRYLPKKKDITLLIESMRDRGRLVSVSIGGMKGEDG